MKAAKSSSFHKEKAAGESRLFFSKRETEWAELYERGEKRMLNFIVIAALCVAVFMLLYLYADQLDQTRQAEKKQSLTEKELAEARNRAKVTKARAEQFPGRFE